MVGLPTDDVGQWLVVREGAQRGGAPERVSWSLLEPRRAGTQPRATSTSTAESETVLASMDTVDPPPSVANQIELLPPTVPLPMNTSTNGFSIASFNMLINEWFSAKYYRHDTPSSVRAWEQRSVLMQELLRGLSPDILCVQEGNGKTFDDDFGFMDGLGYGHVKYSKPFRMPMVTFWRRSHLTLLGEKSANRTVITVFKSNTTIAGSGNEPEDEQVKARVFAIVNCHLSAGDHGGAPRKRLQQVVDGCETARKELAKAAAAEAGTVTSASDKKGTHGKKSKKKKAGEADAAACAGAVCVVGDFNSDVTDTTSNSAVAQFLRHAEIGPDFRERIDGGGDALTSKVKRHRFGSLADAYAVAYPPACHTDKDKQNKQHRARPPSYIAPSLIPKFVDKDNHRTGLTAALEKAVASIFEMFATTATMVEEQKGMSADDVKRWIGAVNGTHSAADMARRPEQVAVAEAKEAREGTDPLIQMIADWQAAGYRGSEFRHALSLLHEKPGGLVEGVLCYEDLLEVYRTVVEEGEGAY